MCTGELQTNNQQLAVRKTEIAAELDLKSNSYVEQVVSQLEQKNECQSLTLLLSLSCYCYCSPYSFVIVSGPLPQMLLLLLPSLSCYWSSLSVVIVIVPLPQLSAKEKELEKLRGDHARIRAEIEEMMTGLNHEQVVLMQRVM